MADRAHPGVDAYIEALPAWQQELCRHLRELIGQADPEGLINQGHGNATARAIQIRRGDTLDEDALIQLLRAIVANNRAGGWRRLGRKS
jgi:hypothetical protein